MPNMNTTVESGMQLQPLRPQFNYTERHAVEFFMWSNWLSNGVERITTVAPLTLEDLKPEDMRFGARPALVLHNENVQKLMDGLWECGFRPTQGSGSAGSLAATQKHLEDIRTVAWHALKIPKII